MKAIDFLLENKIESEGTFGPGFVGDECFVEGGLVMLMVMFESGLTETFATEGRGETVVTDSDVGFESK